MRCDNTFNTGVKVSFICVFFPLQKNNTEHNKQLSIICFVLIVQLHEASKLQ